MATSYIDATQKEAIRSAIALAAVTPDYLGGDAVTMVRVCEWSGKASGARWTPGQVTVDLLVGTIVERGTGERRDALVDADGNAVEPGDVPPEDARLVSTYNGYRIMTVSVFIDSHSAEDGEDATAFHASKLTLRMRRDNVLALLQAGNVALVDIGPIVPADYEDMEGRQHSSCSIDIRFATTVWDRDDDEAGDWIQRAEGQGELEGDVGDDAVDTTFDTSLEA